MIFQSLGSQYNFKQAFKHLITTGNANDSEKLKSFLKEYYGGVDVELYSKGRTALAEAIRMATGGQGRVLITSLTCYSVEQAVIAAGCRPVYVDIGYNHLQFNTSALKKAFEDFDDIKAIVVQNTLGVPVNIAAIKKIADENDVVIIEDLAHAVGSKYKDGTEMGKVGDIVMLSFGREKAVDVTNGGAVILRKEINRRLKRPNKMPSKKNQIRDRIYPLFARTARFLYPIGLGRLLIAFFYKMRWAIKSAEGDVDVTLDMPYWQTKLALEKLKNLDAVVAERQKNAKKILDNVKLTPIKNTLSPEASLIRVPFVVENRHEVLRALKKAGIFLEDVWYDAPVSPRRYLNDSLFVRSEAPQAVKISNEVINIPTHMGLSSHDIDSMAIIINRVGIDAKR